MDSYPLSRRELLQKSVHLIVLGSALPVVAACSGGQFECSDISQLSAADKRLRASLNYVDQSPHGTTKDCANCEFFQSTGDDKCGNCTLIKGPIHPKGYCDSWAAKQVVAS